MAIDRIAGRTVAFNQLVSPRPNSGTLYGITASAADSDGAITITGTADSNSRFVYQTVAVQHGHKFLVLLNRKTIGQTNTGGIILLGNYSQIVDMTNLDYVFYANESYDYLRIGSGTTTGAVYDQKFIPQIVDLTAMYGTTLADSIYAMETAQVGAGVAYVRQRMDMDYYASNGGTLTAPVVSGVGFVGKNLFDISEMADRTGVTVSGNAFSGKPRSFTDNGAVTPISIPAGSTITTKCVAKSDGVNTSGAGWAILFVYADGTTLRPFYTRRCEHMDGARTASGTRLVCHRLHSLPLHLSLPPLHSS